MGSTTYRIYVISNKNYILEDFFDRVISILKWKYFYN